VAAARNGGTEAQQRVAVVREFRRAWQAKDVGALIRILDPSVVAVADGGGLALASPVPIHGQAQVAKSLVHLADLADRLDLRERTVNGQPGLVAMSGNDVLSVYAFDVAGDRIRRIWAVRNPDKLRSWAAR